MVKAMKEKNVVARDILRVVKGEIEREKQTPKGKVELTQPDIVKIIKKLIDSIIESGEDKGEVAILSLYLPKQLTEVELKDFSETYIKKESLSSPKDMGRVMGYFKKTHQGTYDGKVLSLIVKSILLEG